MAKRNLLGDCILRRGSLGELYLMNRQEGGWRSALFPVKSEETLLDEYNVRLGEWTKDECSEYCPVIRLSREEMDTLHDGEVSETFHFHDVGMRGQSTESVDAAEHVVMGALGTEAEAFNRLREFYGVRGPNLLNDGITKEKIRELIQEQHDFGPRGPVLVGEGYRAPLPSRRDFGIGVEVLQDLGPQPHDRDPQAFAQKMSLTAEQMEVIEETLEANGTPLVPVVVNGEVVEVTARLVASTDGYKLEEWKDALARSKT